MLETLIHPQFWFAKKFPIVSVVDIILLMVEDVSHNEWEQSIDASPMPGHSYFDKNCQQLSFTNVGDFQLPKD